jgi:hypothetical protein
MQHSLLLCGSREGHTGSRVLKSRRENLRYRRGSLNHFCGCTDDIDHQVGVGEHGDVATGDLHRIGAHTLRHEALQLRLHGAVLGGHDVRARLRPPGYAIELLCEQVRGRGKVAPRSGWPTLSVGRTAHRLLDMALDEPPAMPRITPEAVDHH